MGVCEFKEKNIYFNFLEKSIYNCEKFLVFVDIMKPMFVTSKKLLGIKKDCHGPCTAETGEGIPWLMAGILQDNFCKSRRTE